MSPTPVTFASPTQPASWSWEATNAEIAARYGVPLESVVRFDTNTAPAPPELVGRLLVAADWEVPLSEYPPSDYGRLIEADLMTPAIRTRNILKVPRCPVCGSGCGST